MTYPEFREQEEEMKSAALIKFQEICDEDRLFQYFWFGVEFKAVGREEDDCPFTSGKYRGAFLAGMEWYSNKSNGNDYVSPERIAGLTPTSNPGGK
jgi:ribosome modulation factor